MKARSAPILAMLVAAVAVLAVACGSSGEAGVTVEKGLAASAEQNIDGTGTPVAMAAAAPFGVAAGAPGAPAPAPAVAGRGGEMMAPATGGILAPFAQGSAAGLTVQGFGRATTPADSARVQFVVAAGYDSYPYPVPMPAEPPVPEGAMPDETAPATRPDVYPTPPSPSTLTEEDLAPLVEAIKAEGVSDGDIEVTIIPGDYYGYYGPESTARVTVILRDTDKVGPVVEAGSAAVNESDILSLQNVGVTYRVDDCDALLKEARKAAVEDGRDNGRALAEALGVSRGDLLAAWEYSYDPTGYSGCTEDSYAYYGPYDYEGSPYNPAAPAEVQIVSNVSLTFAID